MLVVFSPRCALNHNAFAFCGFLHFLSRHPSISLCITKDSHLQSTLFLSFIFGLSFQDTRLVGSHNRLRSKLSCPAALPCNRIFLVPPAAQMSGVVEQNAMSPCLQQNVPERSGYCKACMESDFQLSLAHLMCEIRIHLRSEFTYHVYIYIIDYNCIYTCLIFCDAFCWILHVKSVSHYVPASHESMKVHTNARAAAQRLSQPG